MKKLPDQEIISINPDYDIATFGRPDRSNCLVYRRCKQCSDGGVVSLLITDPPTTGQFYSLFEWVSVEAEQTTETEFSRWQWLADSPSEEFIRLMAIVRAGTDSNYGHNRDHFN